MIVSHNVKPIIVGNNNNMVATVVSISSFINLNIIPPLLV